MELTNDFRVETDPKTTWQVLTDLERIAPCMPGAQLHEIEGEEYRGTVKVKVGPITAQYKGTAKLVECDDNALRAVVQASGRDTRGQGNASATITATLTPDGAGTKVAVVTDLTISGKVAQFGRGVMADVSARLLAQFVEELEGTVLASPGHEPLPAETAVEAPATEAPAPLSGTEQVRRIDSAPAEPIDLVGVAGSSVAKRAALLAVGVVVVLFLLRRVLHFSSRGRNE